MNVQSAKKFGPVFCRRSKIYFLVLELFLRRFNLNSRCHNVRFVYSYMVAAPHLMITDNMVSESFECARQSGKIIMNVLCSWFEIPSRGCTELFRKIGPFFFLPLFTFRRPIFSLLINSLCVSWVRLFLFSSPFALRWISMDFTMFIFSMFSLRRNSFFPNIPSKYLHRTIQTERIFPLFFSQISFCPKVYLAFFFFCLLQLPPALTVVLVFMVFFCCSNWKYQKM